MPSSNRDLSKKEQFKLYIGNLFSGVSERDLHDSLDNLDLVKPFKIRTKVFYSQHNPNRILSSIPSVNRSNPESHPSFGLYSYSTTVGNKKRRNISVDFSIIDDRRDNIFHVVSVAERQEWNALDRLIGNHYPKLVPVYLSQKELINSVKELRSSLNGFDLRVKELSLKEDIESSEGPRRRSFREWTNEALEKVLADVRDRSQVITKITLSFHHKVNDVSNSAFHTKCKISKESIVEITGGYNLARETVIDHISKVGQVKLEHYSNRGLREREYEPAPLAIKYSQPHFEDVNEIRTLVSILSDYPHSNHAVTHGNPFAHIQINDNHDGSCFEIWAVEDNEIAIIPQLKASEASFERIVHYIFDNYREGDVVEFQK